MSHHTNVVVPMRQMLLNFDRWLDAAAASADKRKYDVAVLLESRLAPDQYPLIKQLQVACDNAKGAAARLGGKPVPAHPDTEVTLPEIRARIATVLAFLDTFTSADFETGVERVSLPWMGGKWMTGDEYAEFVVANFYFHAVTAYSILRHNGVELGKADFIGKISMRD